MKFGYKFSNLLGTVYNKGNIVFTPDGNTLISPVGNRVTLFDLVNNTSVTLPVETNRDIEIISISPTGKILIVSDEAGLTYIINLQRHVCLGTVKFHQTPSCIQFSPNNNLIAFTVERKVFFYSSPKLEKVVKPITRLSVIPFQSLVHHVGWSPCSTKVVVSLSDGNIAICKRRKGSHAILRTQGRVPKSAHFSQDGNKVIVFTKTDTMEFNLRQLIPKKQRMQEKKNMVITMEQAEMEDGADDDDNVVEDEQDDDVDDIPSDEDDDDEEEGEDDDDDEIVEKEMDESEEEHHSSSDESEDEKEKEKKKKKQQQHENKPPRQPRIRTIWRRGKRVPTGPVKATAFAYHPFSGLAVVGQKGKFILIDTNNELKRVMTMNLSGTAITSIAINPTGEWIAIGSANLGQLFVWEWKSETFILKQQGHAYNMNTIAYSPDGLILATGGDDCKVKAWNTNSGFCYVTFADHEAPVTTVKFSPVNSQQVLFSASLDGSVRAYDMIRYRNFRTFVSPNKTQFSSLAIDSSGDIVVAGSTDSFEIYVWSVKTGKLTDILSGHTSPVYGLSFNPITNILASASWDKTVRLWDIFQDAQLLETIEHTSDVLTCSYSPDGKRFASSSLDGNIQIFETENWTQIGFINAKNDIMGGRSAQDVVQRNPSGRVISKLVFTPNGSCLIAGGDSKYICIYHVEQQVLLKRYQTTYNLSIDGMLDFFKSNNQLSEFGFHLDTLEGDYGEDEDRKNRYIPGAQKGDLAQRSTLRKIKTYAIDVSPTGRAWSAVTTDGIVIYSLDDTLFFDPTDLTIDITPETINQTLLDKQYLKALVMSLKLNEKKIIENVYQSIPYDDIEFVCHEFPVYHLKSLIHFISYHYDKQPHIELQMRWIMCLFFYHGKYIKTNYLSIIEPLRNLQKLAVQKYNDLSKVCDENQYTLQYFEKLSLLMNHGKSQQQQSNGKQTTHNNSNNGNHHEDEYEDEEMEQDDDDEEMEDEEDEEEEPIQNNKKKVKVGNNNHNNNKSNGKQQQPVVQNNGNTKKKAKK